MWPNFDIKIKNLILNYKNTLPKRRILDKLFQK